MHSLRVYWAYFKQFLMARMGYKADFFVSIFANVLAAASGLLYILFLINGNTITSIGGWSRDEVLFIYGYSMIAMGFFGLVSMNLYRFGDKYVIQGQFDRVLLRPVNTLFQVIFESFNLDALGGMLTGIGVLIYASNRLEISFGLWDIAWFVLSSFSGAVILLSVFVTVASVSFQFEDRIGISAPVYNLVNFGRYPIPIFNGVIQFVLSWVFPFAFVAFYPATHFLQREAFATFCYLTPVVALVSGGVATLAWNWGVKHYTSTGS